MRSTHLDVVDRVRAEEGLERVSDLLTRLDREPPGAEPHRLVIAVGPLNIDRSWTGVAGADHHRLLEELGGGRGRGPPGGARCPPARTGGARRAPAPFPPRTGPGPRPGRGGCSRR